MARHPWQIAMETGETASLDDLLAPGVSFHSPVVHAPFEGIATVAALVPMLRRCFEDVTYTHDLAGERTRALVCSVRIGEIAGQNMQLLRFDDDGLIDDITVMLRPYTLGEALMRLMQPHVQQLPGGGYALRRRAR